MNVDEFKIIHSLKNAISQLAVCITSARTSMKMRKNISDEILHHCQLKHTQNAENVEKNSVDCLNVVFLGVPAGNVTVVVVGNGARSHQSDFLVGVERGVEDGHPVRHDGIAAEGEALHSQVERAAIERSGDGVGGVQERLDALGGEAHPRRRQRTDGADWTW